ncbi:hypothetical protein DM01DRAFT_1339835 [Hesseltinella vesiculosa]|uniref:F-box domain-containing protein n=1 Tax=Hesseltinella vesiculosa TaxID=101127 RepID=A0A1X2G5X1_9FUNG|nr:hypothetical protein DM01DRAFT_1339835 [Hesseltinella vesiculosa]
MGPPSTLSPLTMTNENESCRLSTVPLEVLLKIANYLDFADLWYLATASKSCRSVAHHIIWHKYGIDLYKPRLNAFTHLVHGAVAYLQRHAWNDTDGTHRIIQAVANRLAVEIFDRSPSKDWQHGVDFLMDKTMGILMDHVLMDNQASVDLDLDNSTACRYLARHHPRCSCQPMKKKKEWHDLRQQLKRDPHPEWTPMGKLITDFMAAFQPTMMALFDDHVCKIHHSLLINHLNRQFELLTQRYHYHHKRRLQVKDTRAWQLMNQSVRHTVRVLVRFMGALAQTELLTANDLYTLTQQRIMALFLAQQYHQARQDDQIRNTMSSLSRSGWLDEIEFQMIILFDLAQAVLARQCLRRDAQNEVNSLANMFNIAVSDFLSCQRNSNSHPSSQVTLMMVPSPTSSPHSSSSSSAATA